MTIQALPSMSSTVSELGHSGIREVVNIALTVPDCIRLEVGEPNFPTPHHIVEAAVASARSGNVRYTGSAGLLSLRQKVAVKLATVNRVEAEPNQINIGAGGIGGIAAAFAAVLNPGDEVLLPDPGWPNYRMMLAWVHGVAVGYPLRPQRGFLPDVDEIRALITPRTKLLVINSPSNPTGAVFPPALIRELTALAVEHGIYLLSDECYDELIFEGEHLSPASICTDGRVISAYTFSKTYAMTGWRVGYVVADRRVSDNITKVLESNSSCVPAVSQKAAEAALDGPRTQVTEMVDAYRARRDRCVQLLEVAGILINSPSGAFYLMADVSASKLGAREFAFSLVRNRGVGVAPGTAFGEVASNAVRISLASSDADLMEGISRLVDHLGETAG
jgi:aspartate aminotransferase